MYIPLTGCPLVQPNPTALFSGPFHQEYSQNRLLLWFALHHDPLVLIWDIACFA